MWGEGRGSVTVDVCGEGRGSVTVDVCGEGRGSVTVDVCGEGGETQQLMCVGRERGRDT